MAENAGNLIINEFVAANGTGLTDEDGDYSDWIEIYNQSDQAINLSGWALTDDPDQPEKWTFPGISLGAKSYMVIFASGKNRRSVEPNTELHTNFSLNREREFLGLYNIFERRFTDMIGPTFPAQLEDTSYGRYGQQLVFGYFETPSPGAPNGSTPLWKGITPKVTFSVERGFYDKPFWLELTASPEATIRYTVDGSEPTETNGEVYTGSIKISATTALRARAFQPNFLPSYLDTHTYIFLDDVLAQPAAPPGFPKTWGVHSEDYKDYFVKGRPVMADYEVDPDVVNDPRYRQTIKEDLKSIASLSLVMDLADFTELYSNPGQKGRAWERPVSVELIETDSDQKGFQFNTGLRIQGAWGRWEYMPKHSFRLFFRRQYGEPKLEYPLFPDSPVEKFDTVVLRAGVRSYAGRPDSDQTSVTYIRDEWLRASQIAVSGVGSHGIFVHLYINGLYWGIYNVVERPDADFSASYFGGRKEKWFAANHSGPISGPLARIQEFQSLMKTLNDPTRPEAYAAIKTYLDTAQFSDYIILNWYAGNTDWPDDNWYMSIRSPEGQARFFVWDGETTWNNGANIILGKPVPENMIGALFEILIQNPDFKMEFADRMYQHLFNDGALTDANSQARWRDISKEIDRAIVAESARWGDTRIEMPLTRDDWLKAQGDALAQMEGNGRKLIALARQAGYYPVIDPPVFNQHGGLITPDFKLTLSSGEAGTIYYTVDGSDPRLPVSGDVAPSAKSDATPLILTNSTQIKTRLLVEDSSAPSGRVWSALNEATFRMVEQRTQLHVTEIMYNPIGGDDYEFIELKNTGTAEINLSNMSFDGIRFTFSPTTPLLAPSETIVLVRNPAAFVQRYPNIAFGGTYKGQLSNKGETITLRDGRGKTVVSVRYDDENGWPVSPDGRGDSLVLFDLSGDPNDPGNWRASTDVYGSPGVDF